MKLVQINTVCNGSTGNIMHSIQQAAHEDGFVTMSFVGRRSCYSDVPCMKFGNPISFWFHVMLNTITDRQGHGSLIQTRKLVRELRNINPDIIHLHNLHGYYLHIPTLFKYLSTEYKGHIFWTFHDLWPITGHCPHFVLANCNKWKTQCHHCPNKKTYPISLFFDSSKSNYREKKRLFSSVNNMEIIVPSTWMATHVNNSFLSSKPCHVIHNGIDTNIFRYRYNESTYAKYNITQSKFVILGVASIWEYRKGLNDFIALADYLTNNNLCEYEIVLVGLKPAQIRHLPQNIIGIPRTENREELAELYSRANVFMNPSSEESFSLVTVEAMACGTPAIVLNRSAVSELVPNTVGIILNNNSTEDYFNAIEQLRNNPLDKNTIRHHAEYYSISQMTNHVISLYTRTHQ